MAWQLLLIVYLVLSTATYLSRRQLAYSFAKYNRIVNAFSFVAAVYPIGLIVAMFTSPDLAIGWFNFFLLLLGGAIFPISYLLAYRANKDVDAGLYTIINNIAPVVSITLASLWLHETLSGIQLLGAGIILIATTLVTLPQVGKHLVKNRRALVCAFAAVVLIGLGVVYERYMLTRVDFGAYLVYGWGAQTLWMVALAWSERHTLKALKQAKMRRPLITYSVSLALRGLCFVTALRLSGNASYVVAFASFLPVLVVLSAFFFLKERDHLALKLGGAALGVCGLLLLNSG
jgi:drug/metabolite transporter (DMT)-like permease